MTPSEARDVVSRLTGTLPRLGEAEFERFRALVLDHTGISLGEHGRVLLQARLGRRLRALGLKTFAEYLRHLTAQDATGEELARFVNAVTTNKTEFFREPHHFRYLADVWAPAVRARLDRDGPHPIRFWSAGCSSGEEPYTIALMLHGALGPDALSNVRILASDIDTDMLARVETGIYSTDQVGPIPQAVLAQHFLRGTKTRQGLVRVRPELRALVTARRINLLGDPWPIKTQFDVIFCRNVLIYFDRATQQRVIERLIGYLADDGLLILGHSESVLGLLGGLVAVENTVYRRADARDGQHQRGDARAPRRPSGPPSARRRAAAAAAPARAPEAEGAVKEVTLYIGGVHAATDPTVIKTLVGSCVAACLWDPVARVGGMNHFLLPSGSARGDEATRFGGHAMDRLIAETVKAGGARQRLVAKVFGGARILDFGGSEPGVDQRNIEFVREYLGREGFPVVAADVGGSSPRQIHFETATGRARVKRVSAPTAGMSPPPATPRRT